MTHKELDARLRPVTREMTVEAVRSELQKDAEKFHLTEQHREGARRSALAVARERAA